MNRMLAIIVLGFTVQNAFGMNTAQDRMDIAAAAEAAYLDGLGQMENEPQIAQEKFIESSAGFRTLIDDGVRSSGVWFNLGNALLQSGNIGEAIVALRTAERLDPSNDHIAANLSEARRRVRNRIEPDATDMSFTSVAGWWHAISPMNRLWVAIIGWVVFWTLLSIRTSRTREDESEGTRAVWRTGLWTSVAITIIASGTLLYDSISNQMNPVGVLTSTNVVLRSGNGEGFGPAVEEPLYEGVEFTILEQRPGWWRILLADGTSGRVSDPQAKSI